MRSATLLLGFLLQLYSFLTGTSGTTTFCTLLTCWFISHFLLQSLRIKDPRLIREGFSTLSSFYFGQPKKFFFFFKLRCGVNSPVGSPTSRLPTTLSCSRHRFESWKPAKKVRVYDVPVSPASAAGVRSGEGVSIASGNRLVFKL